MHAGFQSIINYDYAESQAAFVADLQDYTVHTAQVIGMFWMYG